MISFSSPQFCSLRTAVLRQAGLEEPCPVDCGVISQMIAGQTGEAIGERALERVFGIVPSKFGPSRYTVDLLARYCGHENWLAFCIELATWPDQLEQGLGSTNGEDPCNEDN